MKSKKILRIAFWSLYLSGFLSYIILAFLGKITLIGSITLGVYCGSITIYIILYIFESARYNKRLKMYKEVYECAKFSHGKRYQCYLNGNREEIKEWTDVFNDTVNSLMYAGDLLIKDKRASKKAQKEIQDIMDKSKLLITTIRPPV